MKRSSGAARARQGAGKETPLFAYFREDHALLGKGFHELATCLRQADAAGARAVARKLDREGGAHIAFEEGALYPTLERVLGEEQVQRMLSEHDLGLEVIRALEEHQAGPLPEAQRLQLLRQAETMLDHIAECGELFQAVGQLPTEEQERLCEKLLEWRARRPSWTSRGASEP